MRLILFIFLFIQCFTFGQSEVIFSPLAGNHPGLKTINLNIPKGWSVYYTRDGTTPNKSSEKANNKIAINGDEALYFAIYMGNNTPVYTSNTYITTRKQSLPIFSIITDPAYLFDSINGIYEMGCCADLKSPFKGANFWKKEEKQIHIEFIDNNKQAFSQGAGIKIFGGYSVSMPQKSFAIYARKEYGSNRFTYPLFPQLPFKKYKNFVLRNAGGDMQGAHIRDAYATQLTKSSGVAYQEYRPVVVYINGKYWGIYSLREKINEHFINAHFGIDKSKVAIIRPPNKVQDGPKSVLKDYHDLIHFLQTKEKLDNTDISKVQQQIDIEDYLKYSIIQIYLGNSDATENIRLYKDIDKNTPFKTVLFDLDMTLNIFDKDKHNENSLELFTSKDDVKSQYPKQYTILLRKLLTNDSIKNQFINFFNDALNTYFKYDIANNLLSEMNNDWAVEIKNHRNRWDVTELRYNRSINRLKVFIKERPEIMFTYLKEFFDLKETYDLEVIVNKGGSVRLNSMNLVENYNGKYFKDIPIQFEALPDENYEFIGWKQSESKQVNQYINISDDRYTIEAIFQQKKQPNYFGKILISEINIKQPNEKNYEDWIEIYNNSEETIDLSNWILKDNNDEHIFKIDSGTKFLPHTFLILTKNKEEFINEYGKNLNVIGDIPYGFNTKDDEIRLYDQTGFLIVYLDLKTLPKLKSKTNSWISSDFYAPVNSQVHWIEGLPHPGNKINTTIENSANHKNKYLTNTLIFIGIIFGLLIIILFFIILASYIGKDKN